MKYVVVKLNEHLIRDISHFKEIMRKINKDTKNDFKCFKDKAVIIGYFISAWAPSTIYNRFARCFGGKLPWFRYTPDKIVQLSKIMKTMREHLESNDSLNLFENRIIAMQENNE